MTSFPNRFTLLAAAVCAGAPAVQAASGGIDSFWSSATEVKVGDTVNFEVAFSLGTTSTAYGR